MKYEYELNAVREAYNGIKKLCYECDGDCNNCDIGLIREKIVDLEKYYAYKGWDSNASNQQTT